MVCQFRSLIYYLNASDVILYPKGMGRGIQAIGKINELLSVMNVCKNAFYNDAMAHTCHKFIKVLSTECLWNA